MKRFAQLNRALRAVVFFGGCAAIIRQRATQRAIHPVRRTRPAASSASVAKTFRRALPAEEIRKRLIVPAPA